MSGTSVLHAGYTERCCRLEWIFAACRKRTRRAPDYHGTPDVFIFQTMLHPFVGADDPDYGTLTFTFLLLSSDGAPPFVGGSGREQANKQQQH